MRGRSPDRADRRRRGYGPGGPRRPGGRPGRRCWRGWRRCGGSSRAAQAPAPTAAAKSKTQAKAGAAKAGGAKAKVAGGGVASQSPTPAARRRRRGGAGGAAGADPAAGSGVKRPDIRSFNYIVEPHIPLKGAKPATPAQTTAKQQQGMMGGGGGGGGRGGGWRRRWGGAVAAEAAAVAATTRCRWRSPARPGSSRSSPRGPSVKAGDVVCELDSAAFRDELQAQEIRYVQAKALGRAGASRSWRSTRSPSASTATASTPRTSSSSASTSPPAGSRTSGRGGTSTGRGETAKKGFRSSAQVKADELALPAGRDLLRTRPRGWTTGSRSTPAPLIKKPRRPRSRPIRADKLSQESAFQLESDRLRKLEEMVANCTIRAPRDGIVVYANQANSWGRSRTQIQEGVTVRQGQPIFNLPDPKHMQVRAKINESKVPSDPARASRRGSGSTPSPTGR